MYLNDKAVLSAFKLMSKSHDSKSVDSIANEEYKELTDISEFSILGKYLYCISEDGVFRKFNPVTKKTRCTRILQPEGSKNLYTSICPLSSRFVAVALVDPACEEMTKCQILLLANNYEVSSILDIEAKSFKLSKKVGSYGYDVNPVHQMVELNTKYLNLIVAVN